MLDLSLSSSDTVVSPSEILAPPLSLKDSTSIITRSRRPAILTYVSPIINLASIVSALPCYVLGWKTESEYLEVRMFEGVGFRKGWQNVPQIAKVVIEADEKMQFYDVSIKIIARFGGLRYVICFQLLS